MDDWIAITPAELSFLCDAPEGENFLASALMARPILTGSPEHKALGKVVWEERVRVAGGVTTEFEAHLGLLAYVLGFAAQGSAISIEGVEDGAVIFSAVVDDVAAQLLANKTGTQVRMIAWPPDLKDMSEEVSSLVSVVRGIKALRVAEGYPPAGFDWTTDMDGSLADAAWNACRLATLELD